MFSVEAGKKFFKGANDLRAFDIMDLNITLLLLPHLLFPFQLPEPEIHFCGFLHGRGRSPVPQLAGPGEPVPPWMRVHVSRMLRKGKGLTHRSSWHFPCNQGEVSTMDSNVLILAPFPHTIFRCKKI